MHLDGVRPRGIDLLLRTLRLAHAPSRPSPQQPESVSGALLLRERGLGVLPELLRFRELTDRGIEFAKDLFGFGVDAVALGVCEVFAVFLVGMGCG